MEEIGLSENELFKRQSIFFIAVIQHKRAEGKFCGLLHVYGNISYMFILIYWNCAKQSPPFLPFSSFSFCVNNFFCRLSDQAVKGDQCQLEPDTMKHSQTCIKQRVLVMSNCESSKFIIQGRVGIQEPLLLFVALPLTPEVSSSPNLLWILEDPVKMPVSRIAVAGKGKTTDPVYPLCVL